MAKTKSADDTQRASRPRVSNEGWDYDACRRMLWKAQRGLYPAAQGYRGAEEITYWRGRVEAFEADAGIEERRAA